MKILLDTCTFLWLALEPTQISPAAREVLNDEKNRLALSQVSVWEITLKHSVGKLPLPFPPREWIPTRRAFFQIQPVQTGESAVFRSGELPRIHADPFDRLLAAHAIEENFTIVSPDTPLSHLGAARIW